MKQSSEISLQPYFSFEKELWTRRDGAELTLNRFQRFLDLPVVARGPAGSPDEHRVQLTNVIRDGGRFAMWYTAMRPISRDPQNAARVTSHCIAYSDDGIHWEKPDLRLDGRSSKKWPNNILPDLSIDAYNLGVTRDGDRFVATHSYPQKDREATTFTIMSSSDGLRWSGNRKPAIDAGHFETSCSLFEFKGKFWVLGQGVWPYYSMPDGRPCGRVMFAYRSKDLKKWVRERDVAYAYPVPKYFHEAAVQNHAGASPVDRGRIAVGFMGQFWPGGFSEVVRSTFGLVYSYDGAHWTEPFIAEPLLLPDEKSWDCGMLLQGYGIYSRGDTSLYWYSGLDGGNLWWPRSSAGCVRIRRDGYAHFSAAISMATVETSPISLRKQDNAIYVNAQATPTSPIRVELRTTGPSPRTLRRATINHSGVMIPALSVDSSHRGDVSLRFRLSGKSKLYAFYAGPDSDPKQYLADWKEG